MLWYEILLVLYDFFKVFSVLVIDLFRQRSPSVGIVDVLSVNAGERRSPSERSNAAFRVCIN